MARDTKGAEITGTVPAARRVSPVSFKKPRRETPGILILLIYVSSSFSFVIAVGISSFLIAVGMSGPRIAARALLDCAFDDAP
ncbi:MAG: hypothetical protein ACREDC_09765 [Bradyrhizobium sp.]